jgi:MFS family permease
MVAAVPADPGSHGAGFAALYDTVVNYQSMRGRQLAIVAVTPYPSRAIAWYATIVLAFLYWVSLFDRFIISLLVGPIKRDLGLTDVDFGMLHGFGFAITFSLFGLAAGVLADRHNRRWVIFAGVSIWSLATAACGLAQNYWQLLLARVGVGTGEAALNPCATSMISDLFPRERLATALTMYAIGSTIGAGTAFVFGGAIVELVTHTDTVAVPLIGAVRSWQAAFLILGIPGAVLSLIIFTVPEPLRRGLRTTARTVGTWLGSYHELLIYMNARRRFFLCHYLGFMFASLVLVGCAAWYAPHMSRSFGWGAQQVGLTLGLTLAAGGVTGQLLVGRVADAMYGRGVRDAPLRCYAVCLVLAAPVGFLATTSANPAGFLVGLFCFIMLIQSLPSCLYTALNLVTPNELRGTGVALFSATSGLIGAGAGPVVVAAISDHVYQRESAIGLAMGTLIAIGCPLAAVILALGMRPMREAMVQIGEPAN